VVFTVRITTTCERPLQNVDVNAISMTYQNGYPFLQTVMAKPTDDQGEFRLFWLSPGEYYVGVAPRANPNGVGGATQPRTYYPGTIDIKTAVALKVSAGDQRGGIDIGMREERLFTVSGQFNKTISPEDKEMMAAVFNTPDKRLPA